MRGNHFAALSALVVILTAFALGADAQTPTGAGAPVLSALPGSSLTIRGTTTIGAKWHCSTDDVVSEAVMADAATGRAPTAVRHVTVAVRVWDLRCQSGPMERAMRKAMRADHDTTSAILGSFASGSDVAAQATAHLDGSLTVAGVKRAVWLEAAVLEDSDGTLRVRTTLPLLLSSFQIAPPRVLWGAVRARDAIMVDVDLRFPAVGRIADSAARSPRD